MSALKKTTGYSISAASAAAAIALAVDRFGEFAVGAETLASWAIPPVALAVLTVASFAAVKLGYPAKDEAQAEVAFDGQKFVDQSATFREAGE